MAGFDKGNVAMATLFGITDKLIRAFLQPMQQKQALVSQGAALRGQGHKDYTPVSPKKKPPLLSSDGFLDFLHGKVQISGWLSPDALCSASASC